MSALQWHCRQSFSFSKSLTSRPARYFSLHFCSLRWWPTLHSLAAIANICSVTWRVVVASSLLSPRWGLYGCVKMLKSSAKPTTGPWCRILLKKKNKTYFISQAFIFPLELCTLNDSITTKKVLITEASCFFLGNKLEAHVFCHWCTESVLSVPSSFSHQTRLSLNQTPIWNQCLEGKKARRDVKSLPEWVTLAASVRRLVFALILFLIKYFVVCFSRVSPQKWW